MPVGTYDKAGRARPEAGTALYIIAAGMPNKDFVVKIGISDIPYQRFANLLPGIPFSSVMKFAWIGGRSLASTIESEMHKIFRDRNTAGEWFLFPVADKEVLWDTLRRVIERRIGRPPEWRVITKKQAYAFITQSGGWGRT